MVIFKGKQSKLKKKHIFGDNEKSNVKMLMGMDQTGARYVFTQYYYLKVLPGHPLANPYHVSSNPSRKMQCSDSNNQSKFKQSPWNLGYTVSAALWWNTHDRHQLTKSVLPHNTPKNTATVVRWLLYISPNPPHSPNIPQSKGRRKKK